MLAHGDRASGHRGIRIEQTAPVPRASLSAPLREPNERFAGFGATRVGAQNLCITNGPESDQAAKYPRVRVL